MSGEDDHKRVFEFIAESVKEILEIRGPQLLLEQPKCLIWEVENGDCGGCPSALQCAKFYKLMMVFLLFMTHEILEPTDFVENLRRHHELIGVILNAQSLKEVSELPDV